MHRGKINNKDVPDENGEESYYVFAYAKTKGELTKKIKDATLLLN